MGESFWQKDSLTTYILFELWLIMIFTFFCLNDLILYLAIDTVFHPYGIIQNGMEISSNESNGIKDEQKGSI